MDKKTETREGMADKALNPRFLDSRFGGARLSRFGHQVNFGANAAERHIKLSGSVLLDEPSFGKRGESAFVRVDHAACR